MIVSQKLLNEAYPIIERLAKSRSNNGAFAYYVNSDVYQEVWCMCLEALNRYDSTIGPIENYLARHVKNRLKNLKRDKYFRPGSDISSSGLAWVRMNLVNALSLESCNIAEQDILLCSTQISVDPIEYILCNETLIYIQERLPDDLLKPFEELIENNIIRSSLVEEIRQKVTEILSEREDGVRN
jgi:DNA-directed RNA polymerase specialized sigma24 family protein